MEKNPWLQIKQNTCLIKFQMGQYMGHTLNRLFLGRESYPLYNSPDSYSWLHMLLQCKQQHMNSRTIIKRHNKYVWELQSFLYPTKYLETTQL